MEGLLCGGGKGKKKIIHIFWAKGSGEASDSTGEKDFTRHEQKEPAAAAAGDLRRFAFKRIGISVTREQQQMPAYAHAPVHGGSRNAWSWGS